jgi:hypothetical protein
MKNAWMAWMAILLGLGMATTAAYRANAAPPPPGAEAEGTVRKTVVGLPDGVVYSRSALLYGQTLAPDDPVLRLRSPSYALSFTYRLQGE